MKKAPPFYHNCSNRTCLQVKAEVARDYDKESYRKQKMRPPQPGNKGGVATRVIEVGEIPIMGERGTYSVSEHGLGIETRRCREFRYYDRQGETQKPTCTDRKVYNIPRRTVRCYQQFTELLNALSTGKKGAPPTTSNKILALLGCNKSGIGVTTVSEPLSAYLISAVTGLEHNAVRKTMENLVASKKVTSSPPRLAVVDEMQNTLAPSYAKAFDDFITTEQETRKWIAFRRLFGEKLIPETPTLPEAEPSKYMGVLQFKPPKKLSQQAIKRARREAEAWKAKTMITPPTWMQPRKKRRRFTEEEPKTKRYRIKHAPRKKDIYKIEEDLQAQEAFQREREATQSEWA